MAFHLKNLKTQKPKFFESLTASQLCDIVQDGEIMNYINTIPIRRTEIASIFENIGKVCDKRVFMAPGPRQKQAAVHVKLLAEIVKQWEAGKEKYYANLQAAQKAKNNAERLAAEAQANANRKAAENLQRQANAQKAREAEAAAIAAAAKQTQAAENTLGLAAANLSGQTNTNLRTQLMNLKKNMNTMSSKLNKLLNTTRKANASSAAAARRGGKRTRRR